MPRIVNHEAKLIYCTPAPVAAVAAAARTCTQAKGTDNQRLVRSLIKRGHMSPLEFAHATLEITTDRATANALTRHRHLSFCQESTRYVNYTTKAPLAFALPVEWQDNPPEYVLRSLEAAANTYQRLVEAGCKPQQARAILPQATATTLHVAGNLRAWREMLQTRITHHNNTTMQHLSTLMLGQLTGVAPDFFQDIKPA